MMMRDGGAGRVLKADIFALPDRQPEFDGGSFSLSTTNAVSFDLTALRRLIERVLALLPTAGDITRSGQVRALQRLSTPACGSVSTRARVYPGVLRRGRRAPCLREDVSKIIIAQPRRQGWRVVETDVKQVFALEIELGAQGPRCPLAASLRNSERLFRSCCGGLLSHNSEHGK
jgi:hypothetical protein